MNTQVRCRDLKLLDEYRECGSETAFATLARRHLDYVYGVAWRKTQRRDWAEEVAQEVFIVLARKGRTGIRMRSSLRNWLHQTTIHLTAHMVRKESRYGRRNALYSSSENLCREAAASAEPIETEALEGALASLKPEARRVVLSHYYEGKTYKEIGQEIGKGAEACRKQCTRALAEMAEWLSTNGVRASKIGLGIALASMTADRAFSSLSAGGGEAESASPDVSSNSAPATGLSISLAQLAALLIGVAIPFAVMWPDGWRWNEVDHDLIQESAVASLTAPATDSPKDLVEAQINLEWLASELQKGHTWCLAPRQVELQVLVQSLGETQIEKLAQIIWREDYPFKDAVLVRWGEVNPTAALDFLNFEPTIRQLSLAELRSSVSSKFSRNVNAVIKGWVAGGPDGLVEWALAGGEKHINFVRHDDPLALFSPLHAIYLGEELGDEAGLRLQEIAISTWASRDPEAALSWIENTFPKGDAIEKVHLAAKELADRFAGGRRHSDAALQFADWLEPMDPSRAEDVVAKVAEQALRSGEFGDG